MRFITCFALLVTAGSSFGAEPKTKPNVVVIVADELGPRDLGCTGSTYYKTPNLDAFAKQGVKLDEAYSDGDCELYSLIEDTLRTGRHPTRAWGERKSLFRRAKAPNKLVPPFTDPIGKRIAKSDDPKAVREAFVGPLPVELARAKYVDLSGVIWNWEQFSSREKPDWGKPFFAICTVGPASTPSEKELSKYKPGKPGSQGDPKYAFQVEEQDREVGEILKMLDDAKVADNTIVVFTSEFTGNSVLWKPEVPTTSNAPYREGRGYLYEGGLRSPFLIRGLGIKAGGFPIIAADILPTLVGLCGIKSETKYDGVDLSAQFRGDAKPDPARPLYWHFTHYSDSFGKPGGAIRIGNLKLIEYFEDGRFELFDLAKDIGESRNLAAEKPDAVKDMATKLAAWRKEVGAKMPTPNPDYKPNPQDKDGAIAMHARTASVTGTQLRFEPAPHKNTLGYWTNAADTASFEFTVTKPGTFTVSVLQGAGKGSGGAEVELAVGDSKAKFTVKDTGGFQAFELREVGELTIDKAGIHKLTVTPKTKPGVAVMDLREVVLKLKKG